MKRPWKKTFVAALTCVTPLMIDCRVTDAADVAVITTDSRPIIGGKEVDWIDGDFMLKSDNIVAVVANPISGRDANMTVRGVGACLIDMTRRTQMSDQLSAFYPIAGRYSFTDASLVSMGKIDESTVYWKCESTKPVRDDGTRAVVTYTLRDGDSYITCTVQITGDNLGKIAPADGVRADGTFKLHTVEGAPVAYCQDDFFRQTYGFVSPASSAAPRWSNDRMRRLTYAADAIERDNASMISWTTRIYASDSPIDLAGMIAKAAPQTIHVTGTIGQQPRVRLTLVDSAIGFDKSPNTWAVAEDGPSIVHLPPGRHTVRVDAIGHESVTAALDVTAEPGVHELKLQSASAVHVSVADQSGRPSPCKVTFFGKGVDDPDFGPTSADGSVKNCVYSVAGTFTRSIPAGVYDVVISRGPEFDAEVSEVTVSDNGITEIKATLRRVVDTTGWVSAELHSHSSPSGDNTSSQRGRVENLICENLEFAPCTEHQRVASYESHLQHFNARKLMATCTGMELTGSPLPLNHQNAFPMIHTPHAQNGGGPRTSSDPVAQIQRLAMWDDNSDKVVQVNHPNVPQMVSDRDLDGVADGGFSKMLDFTDIMEVHPPESIFKTPEQQDEKAGRANRIYHWLQLIKSGRRIPGVVNTDAHYNWHGSGWLRNWIQSDADEPAKISIDEMTRNLEAGRVIMSTGPFMNVSLESDGVVSQIGDSAPASKKPFALNIRVQCANWLDVNRVEVFVDGVAVPQLSRSRKSHPDAFENGVVKFDQSLPIELKPGSFVVVAAIGEGLTLGRIMGARYGNRPPVVVSNPIYIAE